MLLAFMEAAANEPDDSLSSLVKYSGPFIIILNLIVIDK